MLFVGQRALALAVAASLSQPAALSQPALPQNQSGLARDPGLEREWADRLRDKDPKVRAAAEAALIQGGRRSLPLLRRFLEAEHQDLHLVTLEIIRRMGPPAIPLLVDLLRAES